MAFRSPKKFGFEDDDDNQGDHRRISGIDMSLWRPWLLSDTRSPVEDLDAKRDIRRQTMSPMTALSESPLLQEAMVVRHAESGVARLVNVDAGAKTPPSEPVPMQQQQPAQTPEESPRPRQNSFFTTLQEARTRSSLLASHRAAARGSMEARDSGYTSWRGSDQKQSAVRDAVPGSELDQLVDNLSLSPRSSSSGFSRHSSVKPGGLGHGHVAHQLAHVCESSIRPQSSEPLSVKSSFAGTRLSAVTSRNSDTRLTSTSMQCRCGETASIVEEEPDLGLYGDWAEYYFEPDNFECGSGSDSTRTFRRPGQSRTPSPSTIGAQRRASSDISPKTSYYNAEESLAEHQQESDGGDGEASSSSHVEVTRRTVSPIQQAITKGRREAFTYRTRAELMDMPGYRFEHESFGEVMARQECALGTVWTQSSMLDLAVRAFDARQDVGLGVEISSREL